MSRLVSIRFTDDVLRLVDSSVEKVKGNRSSFVRDACLEYANNLEGGEVSLVKISQENSAKLKLLSSQVNTDHDELLNKLLGIMFDQMEQNPFESCEELS